MRFTKSLIFLKIRSLKGLLRGVAKRTFQTKDQFQDLMRAAFTFGGLSGQELADDMGYSVSSVSRWISGHNAPHPALWPQIISWITQKIGLQIRSHREALLA